MKYGRYEIEQEIGRGSMGVVFRAHDPDIDRPVALKVLREDRVTSAEFVQRFLREARAVGRLSHPNIVTVYDVGQDHGTVYLAMEFIEGRGLDELMRDGPLDLERLLALAHQMAATLAHAHARGIVHRDIKPPNILVTPAGEIKITDFGIARIEDPAADQQTRTGEVLGTPVYMSPEQAMGQPVDGRTDLYSLGVILYELATGRRPYGGETLAALFRAITNDTPPEPATLNPELPPQLARIIMTCLDKDPAQRYADCNELDAALSALQDDLRTGPVSPAAPETPAPVRRRTPLALGAIALVALATAAVFLWPRGTPPPPPPPQAHLQVASDPPGAQIFIDDNFAGQAPQSLTLPAGKHEVRLSLPGHYAWEAQVQLQGDQQQPLEVRLIPVE